MTWNRATISHFDVTQTKLNRKNNAIQKPLIDRAWLVFQSFKNR